MTINNLNLSGIATSVWASTVRKLTSFGATAVTAISQGSTLIPAATSILIQPPTGQLWNITIAVRASSGGSVLVNLYEAGFPSTVLTCPAGGQIGITVSINNTLYLQVVNNDPTLQGRYVYTGYSLNQ